MFFDLVCDPKIKDGRNNIHGWQFTTKLAEFVGTRASLRAELVRRYQDPKYVASHPLIENVLVKCPDENAVLAMLHSNGARQRPFDVCLRTAIENVVVEHRPVSDWPGAYELYSVAVPELRKKLFALTADDNEKSRLAAACLTAIDGARDRHGHVDPEPRHPDIESGRPWPPGASTDKEDVR